jgi:hypothetical protein
MIIGIDPGASGAMAFINSAGCLFKIIPFKNVEWYQVNIAIPLIKGKYTAFIEAVSAMPRDAAHNAFTFGENTGIIKGILIANGIEFTEVYSQKWQRHFGLGAKFESKQARKNAQKAKAQELFPSIKVTLDIADALLIAKYGYDITFGAK